jgi:hypothetical protein
VQVNNLKIMRIGTATNIIGLIELVQPMIDIPCGALDLLLRQVIRRADQLELDEKDLK